MDLKYITLKRLIALSEKGDWSKVITQLYDKALFDGNLRIGFRVYSMPMSLEDFSQQITWGQRMFFAKPPENILDCVLRMFDGWFYPVLSGKDFDEIKCLKTGRKARNCNIDELLPFGAHMFSLVEQMLVNENEKTGSPVNKTWLAAGGDKLAKYGDKCTLDFLVPELSKMYGRKMGHDDVMKSPYLDCLIQLMQRKETFEVEEEFRKLEQEKHTQK